MSYTHIAGLYSVLPGGGLSTEGKKHDEEEKAEEKRDVVRSTYDFWMVRVPTPSAKVNPLWPILDLQESKTAKTGTKRSARPLGVAKRRDPQESKESKTPRQEYPHMSRRDVVVAVAAAIAAAAATALYGVMAVARGREWRSWRRGERERGGGDGCT